MTDKLPPIYFYVPEHHWPANLPENPDIFWQWQISQGKKNLGIYDLPMQAYLHLKADGIPCELVTTMPEQGIVLSHRYWFHDHQRPQPNLLMVCIRGDRQRHPYAQIHVVQNPQQRVPSGPLTLWDSYYIPHWRQSGLIPRDPARKERFENVVYYGFEHNLVPELRTSSWNKQLNAMGLNWHVVENNANWHDYSHVDVVLAVRSFGRQIDYRWKPATKLYQAWAAGVPAILGYESAFRSERKSELDYLEATSLDEVISALERLRDDQEWRYAIVENGILRAQETQPAQLVARWRNFITKIAVPAYERWCNASEGTRQMFLARRYLALKINHVQDRMGLIALPQVDRLKIN